MAYAPTGFGTRARARARAPQQVVDRSTELLSFDVPQRHFECREGRVKNRSISPEAGLPLSFDCSRDVMGAVPHHTFTDCGQGLLNLVVKVSNRFTPSDFTIIGFDAE